MGAQDQQGSLKTNQKVAVWAAGRIGRKVGRGECWDLAEAALEQAGARTSNDLGPVGDDADYVWGDAIDIKDVQAGDILQFRNFDVTTTNHTEYAFADGSFETKTDTAKAVRVSGTVLVYQPKSG